MFAMTEDSGETQGKAIGGHARARALSPEARRDIAQRAAIARWGHKATHRGSFKEDFGIDVDCYVLDDEQKTAVISQRGMGEALGFSEGGDRLPRFVSGGTITPYVGPELREKLDNPIVFQGLAAGPSMPSAATVHGYDVTILIDLCKAILGADAEGKLAKRYDRIVNQARIIYGAAAKSGIKQLVYALSGYDATREEIIRAFKFYVQEEARDYEREFPNQLYREWYRLYELPEPERNKPWKFMHLTNNHVYWPLAKSNGKILELTKVQRAESNDRHRRLHQFLSEVGVKALRQHLGRLLGIAEMSETRDQYEKSVRRIFGEQKEFDF
jgi:hypothetical protein